MIEKIESVIGSAAVWLAGIAALIVGGAAVLAAIGVFSLAVKFFWFGVTF